MGKYQGRKRRPKGGRSRERAVPAAHGREPRDLLLEKLGSGELRTAYEQWVDALGEPPDGVFIVDGDDPEAVKNWPAFAQTVNSGRLNIQGPARPPRAGMSLLVPMLGDGVRSMLCSALGLSAVPPGTLAVFVATAGIIATLPIERAAIYRGEQPASTGVTLH